MRSIGGEGPAQGRAGLSVAKEEEPIKKTEGFLSAGSIVYGKIMCK